MKLSDYVFRRVAEAGVRHVFMLPGGGCMHLVDSLGSAEGLEFVACLHEQGATIAAEAYAQYTNGLGVALVTTGPGGTNALTGVAGAWLESTPLLIVSGQVKRADSLRTRGVRQFGFQEIDVVSLARPITKYAEYVDDSESIALHVDRALRLAREGRPGPVWLDIPLDVQAAEIDESTLAREDLAEPVTDGPGVTAVARRVRDLLEAAERPVLLVGNGVRLARAEDRLAEVTERLGAPVLTTWKALDLLADDHPLFCGRPGNVGQRGANFTQQNADVLVAVGARLDLGQTGFNHAWFARGARLCVVDVDPTEIEKLERPVDVPVAMDAGAFLDALAGELEGFEPARNQEWLERCKAWQRAYPVVLPEFREQEGGVNTYVLIDALSEVMTAADVFVPGSSGSASEMPMQAFRAKRGQRVFSTNGLGAMGFGIPAAVGACVAGGRRTICVDGDGSFPMNLQELEVVRRLALPIKYFVLDNRGYDSIRASQTTHFGGHLVAADPSSGLTLPDAADVAAAFGIAHRRIDSSSDIEDRVRDVLDAPGPVICTVKVSPATSTQPRLASAARADGTMVSRPLEDLWPFLDRRELAGNLLIPPVGEE